jgi:hypothetical protein
LEPPPRAEPLELMIQALNGDALLALERLWGIPVQSLGGFQRLCLWQGVQGDSVPLGLLA